MITLSGADPGRSLLVIFRPLGYFVKILTANDKCSLHNSVNFQQPIKMQLSKKLHAFSQYIAQLLESVSNFKHLKIKHDPRSLCILKISDYEMYGTNV